MRRGEEGSVLVFALGGVLLVLLTTLVLADASSLFMRRAALMTVADNAAVSAATAVDVDAIYADGVGATLVLDAQAARALAQASVQRVDDARLRDVRLDAVSVDGDGVTVTVSAAVPVAFSGITGTREVRIRARASASTPTRF